MNHSTTNSQTVIVDEVTYHSVHNAVVGYVVHHYCLRIGGGVVHDAVVGYLVHNYCLRIVGGVVHDTVGYILYCPPLLFEVWWWSGS
jgi:hypothetical protein